MPSRFDVSTGEGIRDLIDLMKSTPERLDKDLRASFRTLSAPIRDRARSKARAERPHGKRPNRKGTYKWGKLVNSITSGADDDTPTLSYGAERVPGWAGWEFGSDRLPQFPPRTPRLGRGNRGTFFFPTVIEAIPEVNEAAQKVVDDYIVLFANT